MSTPQLPSVELLQGSPAPEPTGPARWRRWKVFFAVFLLAAVIGVAIVYGRSPVYRAATVLTVKPKAVDMPTSAADVEHVAIQKRLLLGEELLSRVLRRLEEDGEQEVTAIEQLRSMLTIVLVPETNLLELRAQGNDPELVHRLVTHWTESYEGFRLEQITIATQRTSAELGDEQAKLALKIESARAELLAFRETHDIVSLQRDENRSLAALRGLNNSLNKARETLIAARARQVAIDEAITEGETVIPREQKTQITKMKLQVERLRARLSDLNEKFTQRYIDRDPDLASLPVTLAEMEEDLARAIELGRQSMTDEARQAVSAAQVSVTTLEQQLTADQNNVQQFTQRFKEFKAIEEGLTRLEGLFADNEERLAQIQIRNQQKFPPLQVVEWAYVPTRPIYPNYERDLMIALGAALGLALFATWLFEYLTERSRPGAAAPYFGVRIYAGDQGQILDANNGANRLTRTVGVAASLAHEIPDGGAGQANHPVLPRELAGAEIRALLAHVDPLIVGYAALLLSGISPIELATLGKQCFSAGDHMINVPGVNQRNLDIGPEVWERLREVLASMDNDQTAVPVADVEIRLVNAARDALLSDPATVNALALWHSYVVYLVRQGVDDMALASRVGAIPPAVHQALMQFAPPDGNRAADNIDFVHPALAS